MLTLSLAPHASGQNPQNMTCKASTNPCDTCKGGQNRDCIPDSIKLLGYKWGVCQKPQGPWCIPARDDCGKEYNCAGVSTGMFCGGQTNPICK